MQNATYDEYGQTVHEDTEQATGCKQPTKIKMDSDQDDNNINGNDTSKMTENKAIKEHQTKNNNDDVSLVAEVEIDKNGNKHSKKRRKRLKKSTNECDKVIEKVSNRPGFPDLKEKRIQFIKAHKFDLIKGKKIREIRDCTYLSDGSVVFADYANSSLIFYDENNVFKREKSIKGGVMFVTNLGTDTIAVSLLERQEILIIETLNMKIKKRIAFNEEVIQGVEGIGGNLIVRVCGLGYKFFGTDGSWIRTINHDGNNMPYIAGSEDAIYYTNWETHRVGCINSNGVKTFIFSKEGFMAPNGVAVDKDGYVYVMGSHSHNVVVFAKDFATTNHHQIFEMEMKYPMAVDCCKNDDQIIICSIRGNVAVFQTKHE